MMKKLIKKVNTHSIGITFSKEEIQTNKIEIGDIIDIDLTQKESE